MKKNFIKTTLLVATLAFAFASCSDDDKDEPWVEPKFDSNGAFILSEGSANNSQIAYYDIQNDKLSVDAFEKINKTPLGDTGNDILIYGSKMYTAVFGSAKIAITDLEGKLIPEKGIIDLKDKPYKQPRYLAAHGKYVYVDAYEGYLAKIDTTSLQIVATLAIKPYSEQMAVYGNELYVTNSNHYLATEKGETVTVVDLNTFTIKGDPIKIRLNPTRITSDNLGNIYVISMGNYGDIASAVSVLDSKTREVKEIGENLASTMQMHDNTLLLAYRDWNNGGSVYKSYDIIKQLIINTPFITIPDEHKDALGRVHGISSDPIKKDIYITVAGEPWDTSGSVFVFSKNGQFKKHLPKVGVGPAKVEFTTKQIN